jgi:hypothetical protein
MRRYDDCAILPRVRSFEDLARGAVIQRLAQSFVVVEIEVGGNTPSCLGHAAASLQVHF